MTNEQQVVMLYGYRAALSNAINFARGCIDTNSLRESELHIDGVLFDELPQRDQQLILASGGVENLDEKRVKRKNTGEFVALEKLMDLVQSIENDIGVLRGATD